MKSALSAAYAIPVLVCLSAPALSQPAFQTIGDLPGGGWGTTVHAVSANGLFVAGIGNSINGVEAFRWFAHGVPPLSGLGDLPERDFRSQGWGISGDGQAVVGQCRGIYFTAYKWTPDTGMVGLGGLVPSSYNSSASAISADGRFVVGWANTHSDPITHAVRWDTAGAVTCMDLGDLPGGTDQDFAHAVSADGSVVVGQAYSTAGLEAFRWTAGTGMVGLGDLPGSSFDSRAYDVSGDGLVVVGTATNAAGSRAFRWTQATGMVALPLSDSGDVPYEASAVSSDGSVIVGGATGGAYIWTATGGTQLLVDVLAEQGTSPPPGVLYNANDVSADGCTVIGGNWIARLDRDGDGLLDCWETSGKGIDADGNGTYDLCLADPPHNADPDHKDIFVEFDAMVGLAPRLAALNAVRDAFADAPVENPDDDDGITLHSEYDNIAVFPRVAWTDLDANGWPREFDTFKAANFGTQAERDDPNAAAILAAKRMAFRYCVFAHTFGTENTSGAGEIGGNDFFVSLGGWPEFGGTQQEQSGTYMHELGHTLGLRHGGDQHDPANRFRYQFKPNYYSVMNYSWQTPGSFGAQGAFAQLLYLNSWRLDYSREELPAINEEDLFEGAGLGGNAAVFAPVGPPPLIVASMGAAIDFDRDGDHGDVGVEADVNHLDPLLPASPRDILEGHDDWANLKYSFRDHPDYADGAHSDASASDELTLAIRQRLSDLIPSCEADIDGDGFVTGLDFDAFVAAFEAGEAIADFDHDGFITGLDFDAYIAFFEIGC